MFTDYFSRLASYIPAGRPVLYFDYAVYGNVGDLLIHKATEYFFECNGNVVLDAFNLQNFRRGIKKRVPSDAVIVFQGGGNFGDLFPRHDQLRLRVLERFESHQAVMLPQTVYFKNEQTCRDLVAQYDVFSNLTLCLRDTRSYETINRHVSIATDLLPDMAHVLEDSPWVREIESSVKQAGQGELHFMRQPWKADDKAERPFNVDEIRVWNWPEYLTDREKKRIEFARNLHRWDRRYFHSRWPQQIWRRQRDDIIRRALVFFSGYDSIHTNRLHGGLIGLLCRKPVVFYDTGYGKLEGYYSTWLNQDSRVRFAGAIRPSS